ncbi:fimbrial protein [Serratia fonticola]|uniref:fimbrial protein n=1 Tax=Serratia fonticola TaxID=47917 RepID=UPI000E0F769B|nr:fimbrial protein [Serratia fonticola]RDL18884.1 type 1 fimbria pilin [Serratia fonticola]
MKTIFCTKAYAALLGSLFFLFSHTTQAVVTCSLGTARTETATLTPSNISAGPDLPVGTVIYRSTWIDASPANQIKCTTDIATGDTGKSLVRAILVSAPYPLSSWAGSPFPGAVYQTNIPGVGVAVWFSNIPMTTTSSIVIGAIDFSIPSSSSSVNYGFNNLFDFSLIKIGEMTPGVYNFNAPSSLPVVKIYLDAFINSMGFPITTRTINFSGTLQISAQTCTTPDVNTYLGSYDTALLSSVGSTPWVDSSIKLTNCPVFRGYYPTSNPTMIKGSSPSSIVSTNNQFGIRLNPTSAIIDAANGVMSVTTSANAATGVGIQMAYGTAQSPELFNFMNEKNVISPKDGSRTITLPLVARYIKTAPTVTPGRADGKVTFTVSYY